MERKKSRPSNKLASSIARNVHENIYQNFYSHLVDVVDRVMSGGYKTGGVAFGRYMSEIGRISAGGGKSLNNGFR